MRAAGEGVGVCVGGIPRHACRDASSVSVPGCDGVTCSAGATRVLETRSH